MIAASIAGASGYTGGELLRLLLGHPGIEVAQATSERNAGRFVHGLHPNLRGATRLKFSPLSELAPCDVLFLCLPHGRTAERIDDFRRLAPRIVDSSADFRLRDPADYDTWYGRSHPRPELLPEFVYGIPELHRESLRDARLVACAGCNATAAILALAPLCKRGGVGHPSSSRSRRARARAGRRRARPATTRSAAAACAPTGPPAIATWRRCARSWRQARSTSRPPR